MELGILCVMCVMCVLLGVVIGLFMARATVRRVRPEAPAPVDLGYDPNNPMNCGRERETEVICGATWYRIGGAA